MPYLTARLGFSLEFTFYQYGVPDGKLKFIIRAQRNPHEFVELGRFSSTFIAG